MTRSRIEWSESARQECRRLIQWAMDEDLGSPDMSLHLDITSCSVVPHNAIGLASFVSRQKGIVCGIQVCEQVLETAQAGLQLEIHVDDGQPVNANQRIATLSGNAREILTVERTCLNFLGRLSGISSLTDQFVRAVTGTQAAVFDTRKTTPGWRHLEKYAVVCGGGHNHRFGLYDAILIKDNHLAMMDDLTDEPLEEIPEAVRAARRWIAGNSADLLYGDETTVEIEVDTFDQFVAAIAAGPDIILLDNMNPGQLAAAVDWRNRNATDVLLEASGGVNLDSIGMIAQTGVDRISVGSLTHSAVNFDIGLDWQME